MDDKTRILLKLIRELDFTLTLAPCCKGFYRHDYTAHDGREYVHFGKVDWNEIKIGDLVLCQSSGIHDFTVGYVHSKEEYACCVIRELGSNDLCRIYNEGFAVIYGMNTEDLLEGDQYRFKMKVLKAFHRESEYNYRYGGIRFEGKNEAVISVREPFGGFKAGKRSVPFEIKVNWDKKTSIKKIIEEMRNQGFGTKEYTYVDEIEV